MCSAAPASPSSSSPTTSTRRSRSAIASPCSVPAASSRWARPSEIYERPATPFVAGFVGASNLIDDDLAAAHHRRARPLHDPSGEDPHRQASPSRSRTTTARSSGRFETSSISAPQTVYVVAVSADRTLQRRRPRTSTPLRPTRRRRRVARCASSGNGIKPWHSARVHRRHAIGGRSMITRRSRLWIGAACASLGIAACGSASAGSGTRARPC